MREKIWTLKFTDKNNPDNVKFLGKSKIQIHYGSDKRNANDWKSRFSIPLIDEPVGVYCNKASLQPYVSSIQDYDKLNTDFPYNVEIFELETINAKIRNRLTPIKNMVSVYQQYLNEEDPTNKAILKKWCDDNLVSQLTLSIDKLLEIKGLN